MTKTLHSEIRAILRDHDLAVRNIDNGAVVVFDNNPFGRARQTRSFKSWVSMVDYYKPILRDERLTELYV